MRDGRKKLQPPCNQACRFSNECWLCADDIDKAQAVVEQVVKADARVLADPAPLVVVGNLGESSVDLTIRVWCHSGDCWPLKYDLTKRLKQQFDAENLTIPFPQRTIHMIKADG